MILWYNDHVQDTRQSLANRRFLPLYPEHIHDLVKGGGLLLDNDMAKEILLTQGKVAIVDDNKYDLVSRYKWHAMRSGNTWYAGREENGTTLLLHRFLTSAPDNIMVDHKDGDGLNCTDKNMRFATRSQNQHNRTKNKGKNSSIYKGVFWCSTRKKWASSIKANCKDHKLGYFDSEIAAANAYDKKAIELHGEFAKVNFP